MMLRRLTAPTRRKIVAAVAASDFGNRQYRDASEWGPMCEALGVTPELLREAVLLHRSVSVFNNPQTTDQLMLRMTKELKSEVIAFCKERGWKMTPLIWTLANEYLHDTAEPKNLIVGRRGKKMGGVVAPGMDLCGIQGACINARFTPALRHALSLRATSVGATPSGILRGLLVDVMTGQRPPPLRLLQRRELQAHADYLVPSELADAPSPFRPKRLPSIADDGVLDEQDE